MEEGEQKIYGKNRNMPRRKEGERYAAMMMDY
jgi:hypothetical protein